MHLNDGVALLVGASTVPAARRRGAQNALLSARLAFAHARGCDLAVMGALPGSASQRNAERDPAVRVARHGLEVMRAAEDAERHRAAATAFSAAPRVGAFRAKRVVECAR